MLPVMASHIRVDVELSSTIWERAFECLVMGGKVSERVEWKPPERAYAYRPCVCLREWRGCWDD